MTHPAPSLAEIDAVRRFNRFATARAGALNAALLGSGRSLAEARVLWELGHSPPRSAARLAEALALDPAYLARILRRFREAGLAEAVPDPADARARIARLTPAGAAELAGLEDAARAEVRARLAPLSAADRTRLLTAMAQVESGFDPSARPAPEPTAEEKVRLRAPGPGDMGWVVSRHGALYAAEFGMTAGFEALVARISADFIETAAPETHRGWIAARGETRLGAVFLVPGDPLDGAPADAPPRRRAGKLRMLLVEPEARGLGLGRRLVSTCIETARALGYPRLDLWTHDRLTAARALYAAEGFARISSAPHECFGVRTMEEVWRLDLVAATAPA